MNREQEKIDAALRMAPIERVVPRGSIRWAFWGLRFYVTIMVGLVMWGFSRGLH